MLVKTHKDIRRNLTINMSSVIFKFNSEGIAEVDEMHRELIENMSGSPYFLEILENKSEVADKSESVQVNKKMTVKELIEIAKDCGAEYEDEEGNTLTKAKIVENIKEICPN